MANRAVPAQPLGHLYLARRVAEPQVGVLRQARIAACHAIAGTPEETDWARIASLYDTEAREPTSRGGGIMFDATIGTDDDQIAVAGLGVGTSE